MKTFHAILVLFCVTNAATFGLHRLFPDFFRTPSGPSSQYKHSNSVQYRDPSLLDAMYWDELGDSGSSEEFGLHFLYHFFNNYNTGNEQTDVDTTTMKIPTSSPKTTKPTKTTEILTSKKNISAESSLNSTTKSTTEKTKIPPPSTTEEAATTSRPYTTSEEITETTAALMTTPTDQSGESSSTQPTTTAYSITTEDTFIEGDLNSEDNVNKTDLNSTDDVNTLVEEYNDYIDEGPTRGDRPSINDTRSKILPEVIPTSGSGIIDASLSNMKIISNLTSQKRTKQSVSVEQITATPTDVSLDEVGNVFVDRVIQSLNNKHQTNIQKNSGDLTKNNLGNGFTTRLPKPTVFFTLPGAQNDRISDSQQKLLSERVAKIGNDFVILPDFKSGAVLLEPIVSSGKINTNTIPNFEYVPPKTLSFETIPGNV